jgi:hypothetical protein
MSYTLSELRRNQIIDNLVLFIEDAVSITRERSNPFERRRYGFFKKNDNLAEYQNEETVFNRLSPNDRIFPLETVELQSFNEKHDTHIEYASIHVGDFADELTRSLNVVALTIASDIFFRSNNYNTTSVEGRKTLAHELTHVSQYEENDIFELTDKEKLEREAESAEAEEAFEIDPIITTKFNGKPLRIRKSEKKEMIRNTVDTLLRYVERQKYVLEEEKYLKFLCTLKEYCEDRFFTVVKNNQGGYDLAKEIEDEFKANIRF